jgi:hypothetical protein
LLHIEHGRRSLPMPTTAGSGTGDPDAPATEAWFEASGSKACCAPLERIFLAGSIPPSRARPKNVCRTTCIQFCRDLAQVPDVTGFTAQLIGPESIDLSYQVAPFRS